MENSFINKYIDINDYWEKTRYLYEYNKTYITKGFLKYKINKFKNDIDKLDNNDKETIKLFFENNIEKNFWNYYKESLEMKLLKPSFIQNIKINKNYEFIFDYECMDLNLIKKGYLLLFSYDYNNDKTYYLLAQDASIQSKNYKHKLLKEINMPYDEKKMNSLNEDYDDFKKWGLIGGSKKNFSESIIETTSREFIEETMGLIFGCDYLYIKRMIANKEYSKKLILKRNSFSTVIYIKHVKYSTSLHHLERTSNDLYIRLLKIRACNLLLKENIMDERILKSYITRYWNSIKKYNIVNYLKSPDNIKEDFIEKEKLKWWDIEDIKNHDDEMKKESAIILLIDCLLRK